MRLRRNGWRTGLGIMAIVAAVGAAAENELPASAADADAYAFRAGVTWQTDVVDSLGSIAYSFDSGACQPPVGSVPGYVDASGSDSGECGPVSGKGDIVGEVACDTGLITAVQWSLTEPGISGDTAVFQGDGVVVGGVAIIAGPPVTLSGPGYTDGGSSLSGAVAVALFGTTSQPTCLAPSSITAVLAAAY